MAFVGIFDVEKNRLGLARNAKALDGSEMICFGSNECSQPIPPSPEPSPTPTPTPKPKPDKPQKTEDFWAGDIQIIITDSFLILLVIIVIGTFIYCCRLNKRERAAKRCIATRESVETGISSS